MLILGDESDKYGQQRLWGTIGWGIFQLVAGYLIDTSSHGKLLKDYTSSFYLTAGLLTIDLIVAYKWTVSFTPLYFDVIKRTHCYIFLGERS